MKIPFKKDDKWLSKALLEKFGNPDIPAKAILSKTLTGIGATFSEINSKRNSIIIEPNIPVIVGKCSRNENILPVYGSKTKQSHIEKYLKSEIPEFKKIITTPESFSKVLEAANKVHVDIYQDYFGLYDECEKVIQDSGFRRSISTPMFELLKFKQSAVVSATPLITGLHLLLQEGFTVYEIEPDFDYSKDIELIISPYFLESIREKFREIKDSSCICIFFNSIKGINEIITTFDIKDQSSIFCSEDAAKELRKKGFENVFSEIEPKLSKYNFFTSRFYSAVDIEIPIKPDIIMLSDSIRSPYSLIDPETDSIQIQGRFRNSYQSLSHIIRLNPEMAILSKEELDRRRKQYHDTYALIKTKHTEAERNNKPHIKKDFDKLEYQYYLDKNGQINPFSIENEYYEERVKGYYIDEENLLFRYKNTKHFKPHINSGINESCNLQVRFTQTTSFTKKVRFILESVKGQSEEQIERQRKAIHPLFEDTDFVFSAYKLLGDNILGHRKDTIEKLCKSALFKMEEETKLDSEALVNDVYAEFMEDSDEKINPPEAIKRLQSIFTKHCITKSPTISELKRFFELKQNKDKENPYIRLTKMKKP